MTTVDKYIHRPWYLVCLLPVYRLIKRYWPDFCKIPPDVKPDVYASSLPTQGNIYFRLIFPPFFKKIRHEIADENKLMAAHANGIIVYVTRGIGKLEYNYFQNLFPTIGLPAASFANDVSLRVWMPWTLFKATLLAQFETMERLGGIPDPVNSNWLTDCVATGKSALLRLFISEEVEDPLLLSYGEKLLLAIIRAQRKTKQPIFIVPLDFVWDKRPSKARRTMIDVLFGEKEQPSRFRKVVLFWRNYRKRAVAKIGEPLDLSVFLKNDPNATDEAQSKTLRQEIHNVISTQRRIITGPPIRPRKWFIDRVLTDQVFQKTLCEIAAKLKRPADDLRDLARIYMKEIAADINFTYVEFWVIITRWAFNSFYDGIIFNEEGLSHAKQLYAKAPVIFVPNHKSHMDYLLLSNIFYQNYMTIPHVAAGINLSFWPLGHLFRGGGAYFIKRSFGNNQLYRATVETYLRILLEEGYSHEFFIEGGRSRTGKLSSPRYGMISMFLKTITSGAIPDLHFIPVSFTYDRVIEQKSYQEELAGGAKKKERPTQLLRLVKYLKRQKLRYGKIYVNFGTPISFQETVRQKGIKRIVETIADDICDEINRNIVVTPQSIVAATLLSHPERAVTLKDIHERSLLYLNWLFAQHAQISQAIITDTKAAIETALDQLTLSKFISRHNETDETYYTLDEDKRLQLDYFKNGCIHFLASISVFATLLLRDAKRLASFTPDEFLDEFKACQQLLKYEFRFSISGSINEHLQNIAGYLAIKRIIDAKGDGCYTLAKNASSFLIPFSNLLCNFFESMKVALFTIYSKERFDKIEEKDLVKLMLQTGKKMLLLGSIKFSEAISNANLANSIHLLCDHGIIHNHAKEMGAKGRSLFSSTGNREALQNLKVQLERLL